MRVLITTDTVGGVWTFTSELSLGLLQRGHAVSLVSFGRLPSPSHDAWVQQTASAFGNHFEFTASTVPLEWMEENHACLSDGEPVLAAVAALFQPDILCSNQFCYGAVSFPLPRLVVAHSDVLSWARAAKPEALIPCPWLNRYTSLVQRGLLQADVVTAPTHNALRNLKTSFFFPMEGVVIPNGRSLPELASASSRKLQAVTAGRLWDEAKGLSTLSERPLPLPILIAGEQTEGQRAAPTFTPGAATFLGQLTSDVLHKLFRESAAYLCTSLYEPFGLAPLEAALCGCTLVLRDLPSLREVWGDAALYFRDADHLAAQLNLLCHDPATLAEGQRRARQRARDYTADRLTDSYLVAFEAVLQGHRTTSHVA